MHVAVERGPRALTWTFTPGEGEPHPRARGAMVRTSFGMTTPPGPVHPDLIVLTALLACRPWLAPGRAVTCDLAVSRALADGVARGARIELAHVDEDLTPRPRPDAGRPGLAFSGGTDSVATLAVMPPGSISYFLHRVAARQHPATSYVDRGALESCAAAARQGYDVRVVPSDVEYVRSPVGFPDDLVTIAPALVHADADDLDAIAWGAPLESTYRLQKGIFRDFADSPFLRTWGPAFEAVGLDVVVPIAGVSEVVTSRIVVQHPLGAAAQSCMRGGRLGRTCGACNKCARKALLTGAATGRWPSPRTLDRLLSSREARAAFLAEPMKVEPVVAHVIHRHVADTGGSELTRLLAAKAGSFDYPWLRRAYAPGLDHVPQRYLEHCRRAVGVYARPMSAEEEKEVETFSLAPALASPERAEAQLAITQYFDATTVPIPWRRAGPWAASRLRRPGSLRPAG